MSDFDQAVIRFIGANKGDDLNTKITEWTKLKPESSPFKELPPWIRDEVAMSIANEAGSFFGLSAALFAMFTRSTNLAWLAVAASLYQWNNGRPSSSTSQSNMLLLLMPLSTLLVTYNNALQAQINQTQ